MGNTVKNTSTATTKDIDKKMKSSANHQKAIQSLLLLGAGESGKSTLMRQMRHIWGKQYQVKERESYRNIVWENVIECMKILCQKSVELNIPDCTTDQKIEDSLTYVNQLHKTTKPFDDIMAKHFDTLWKDPGIQNTLKHRDKYYIMDSATYFLNNVSKYIGNGYVPTFDEICRCRVRTLGIRSEEFIFNGVNFRVFDVGGQRSERKKWFSQFDNCKAIMFVCSLAGYHQVIFEDQITNQLLESFAVYEKHINHKSFVKINVILFLNKKDLFDQLIQTIPFTVCPCDYNDEPQNTDKIISFIISRFQQKTQGWDTKTRSIFPHVTCATNTENIKVVFKAVQHIVQKNQLQNDAMI